MKGSPEGRRQKFTEFMGGFLVSGKLTNGGIELAISLLVDIGPETVVGVVDVDAVDVVVNDERQERRDGRQS